MIELGGDSNRCVTRRHFLVSTAVAPFAAAVITGLIALPFLQQSEVREFILRPPGALDERRFIGACVKCGKCVQACPYKAIKVAGPEYGLSIGTPFIAARDEPCQLCPDFPCAKACPSGALDKDLSDIQKVKMGTAVIIDRENCLSIRGLRCEVCYRNCPLIDKAITIESRHNLRTGEHTIMEPVVHQAKCVGCGICEKSCVRERPVIVVQKVLFQQKDSYEF